jgi:hypothetical protein
VTCAALTAEVQQAAIERNMRRLPRTIAITTASKFRAEVYG